MQRFKVGDFIIHATQPAWGAGKVTAADSTRITVVFLDGSLSEAGPGKRFPINEPQLSLAPDQAAAQLAFDVVPSARRAAKGAAKGAGAGRVQRVVKTVTFEEALRSFQSHYNDFNDPRYIGSKKEGERKYKELATDRYRELLGDGRLGALVAAGDAEGVRWAILEIQKRVKGLVYHAELSRQAKGLRNDEACLSFGSALDDLLQADEPSEALFERYLLAARNLTTSSTVKEPLTWPLATYLPYFCAPEKFILLKKTTSVACAERLGMDFDYESKPNWQTYQAFHAIAAGLLERLRPYGARDFIDAQSFIYVIVRY